MGARLVLMGVYLSALRDRSKFLSDADNPTERFPLLQRANTSAHGGELGSHRSSQLSLLLRSMPTFNPRKPCKLSLKRSSRIWNKIWKA